MATLPRATARLASTGGGVGVGSDLICVMACTQSGLANSPRLHQRVQAYQDSKGLSDALEFAAHYVETVKKPFLEIKLETATAGAVVSSDTTGVTGSSTVVFSGAARMSEHMELEVVTGGTVGTAGIELKLSRDGGRTQGRVLRLGVATSIALENSGITATFQSGKTLVAGDLAVVHTVGPMWDADGLAAGFDALAAQSQLPRLVLLVGDITNDDLLQDVIDEIEAYETEHGRHSRVLVQLREPYADASMQTPRAAMTGAPSDLDFDATADTITRNTGSWVTDGFVVGMSITVDGTASNDGIKGVVSNVTATVLTVGASPGLTDESNVDGADVTIVGISPGDLDFVASGHTITRNVGSWVADGFKVGMTVTIDGTASNDGVLGELTDVSATVLTFASGVVDEASLPATGVSITAHETNSSWVASLGEDIVGNSEATMKISQRVLARAGNPRRKSPIDGYRRQRPFAWAVACAIMAHDLHISEAKVEVGALGGWTIVDEDGILETHDERVDRGLLAIRVGCPTTHDDIPGVFSALALTLDEDDAIFSRAPVGFVGDLICTIAKRETTRKLSTELILNPDGTISEPEKQRIEKAVDSIIAAAVLTRRAEGQRVSGPADGKFISMADDVDLREPGAEVPCEVVFEQLGYLEQIRTTVRASRAGS